MRIQRRRRRRNLIFLGECCNTKSRVSRISGTPKLQRDRRWSAHSTVYVFDSFGTVNLSTVRHITPTWFTSLELLAGRRMELDNDNDELVPTLCLYEYFVY